MNMSIEKLNAMFLATFTFLIGGIDLTLKILLIFILADFITGLMKAFKTSSYTSKMFRNGIMSKSGYFVVIIIAYQMDLLLFNGTPTTRTAAAIFYIWVEFSSIVENLGAIGVQIPPILSENMKKLKKEEDTKEEGEKKL